MRHNNWFVVLAGMVGCSGDPPAPNGLDCPEKDQLLAYTDSDDDGFGSSEVGIVCELEDGQSDIDGDCNDADPTVYPDAEEVCDGIDNSCDNVIDEFLPKTQWFSDADGDGYGITVGSEWSCERPDGAWVETAGDCNGTDNAIHPEATEVCDGIDNDCDSLYDDADDTLDLSTQNNYYYDADGDGAGTLENLFRACFPPSPQLVTLSNDCDDTSGQVSPLRPEVCDDIDNDCDLLIDDEDDSIVPESQTSYFVDADLDGYGDPDEVTLACKPIPGAVTNNDDCDDTDNMATLLQDWYTDGDLDGVGGGTTLGISCHAPSADASPELVGLDCDDADPARYPGALEICEDLIDQDCSGADRTCATWLYTVREFDDVLRRWDADTGSWQDIGPLNTPFDFGDLAYDSGSQTLYMVDGRGFQGLHTVDLLTGQATLIGIHGIADLFGLAWDSSTGTLYGSGESPTGFYEMDIATGAAIFVGNPGVALDGLTYDSLRDQIVGVSAGPGDLWSINRANGAPTFLSNWGFVNNCGLAYAPTSDLHFAIDWSGVIYRWDPNSAYQRTIVSNTGISHDGFVYIDNPPN